MSSGRPDLDARFRIRDLPVDEPYFVILARDALSGPVVRGYAAAAAAAGVDPAVVESALKQADAMDGWAHKKLPDADHLLDHERKQLAYELSRRAHNACDDVLDDERVLLAERRGFDLARAQFRLKVEPLLRRARDDVSGGLRFFLSCQLPHTNAGGYDVAAADPHDLAVIRASEQLLADLNGALGVRACRVCGCWEERACEGGCGWASGDLCDACTGRPEAATGRAA